MQETTAPAQDTSVIEPLAIWLGLVRYYGSLSAKPGWEHLVPLFDFVKQLSTSVVSVDYFPSLIEDALVISKTPIDPDGELPRRLLIDVTAEGHVLMTCFSVGDDVATAHLDAPRESALDALWHLLQDL